jgi:hypothetical protein
MPSPDPETVALVRRRYLERVPVSQIMGESGLSLGTLYFAFDGKYDDGSGTLPAPLPRRRVVIGQRKTTLRSSRASLVARLWRTAEAQVRGIEDRVMRNGQPADERERDARSLAVLVKTLRELALFDERNKAPQVKDDDEGPRDIDEFRRELARKIDAIIAARSESPPGET